MGSLLTKVGNFTLSARAQGALCCSEIGDDLLIVAFRIVQAVCSGLASHFHEGQFHTELTTWCVCGRCVQERHACSQLC